MAKIIDYPRASLRAALQVADAVDGFAGSCSVELAAEKLGKKVGGAFAAQISAAVKYGLIDSKGGKLSTTALYRNFKLAYTPEESSRQLQAALLSPPLFANIFERFKGERLPISHFEKMLIREFGVPDDSASRVSGYFLDGAKQTGLLDGEHRLLSGTAANEDSSGGLVGQQETFGSASENSITDDQVNPQNPDQGLKVGAAGLQVHEGFWLNIRGPGMNFSIEIEDLDDLEIVQVMLRKIERALKSNAIDS